MRFFPAPTSMALTMPRTGCCSATYASFIGSFRAGSVIASIFTA